MERMRRLLAAAVCLGLLLSLCGGIPASATQEDIYLPPIAGGVAQVAVGPQHIAVLRCDGTVAAIGDDSWGQCQVSGWSRVVKIWAGYGVTLGLTDSGELLNTVAKLPGLTDIVDVDVDYSVVGDMTVVVGLKADGTAVSFGINERGLVPMTKDICNVTRWTDLTQVLVYDGIYGLRSDGTVLSVRLPGVDQPEISESGWTGVRELAKNAYGVFAITHEGKVLSQHSWYGCDSWTDVQRLIPGSLNAVYGLTSDGRLLAAGEVLVDTGDVSGLADVAIGTSGILGLQTDGTVVYISREGIDRHSFRSWKGVEALIWDPGFPLVSAIQRDGTVVSAHLEDLTVPGDCHGWTDIAGLWGWGMTWVGVERDGELRCNVPELDLSPLTEGIRDTRPRGERVELVAAGLYHSICVRNDGKVDGSGVASEGGLDVEDWSNIVAVAAAAHTVGLRADGTVVAVGPNGSGQCQVSGWTDIVDIGAGYFNTVGLRADGTVVVAGSDEYGQLSLSGRRGIVDVAAGGSTVYAVTNKGRVYCAGSDVYGQKQVDDWSGIVAVAAGTSHVVGLRADGTVVAAGLNEDGQCEVEGWTDIVAVSAGSTHTVGLRANGTVVFAGGNAFGQSEVEEWADVISISAGAYHTLGITSNGTVLAAGSNEYGQCKVAQ